VTARSGVIEHGGKALTPRRRRKCAATQMQCKIILEDDPVLLKDDGKPEADV
jgi:hypothetical protein